MEYNKSCLNEYDCEKYIEIFKKKDDFIQNPNTNDTNLLFIINNFQNKIKELDEKLEFFKKYYSKLDTDMDYKIKEAINMIDQVIIKLDKNVIEKAQIKNNKKNNFIELEF